MRVVSLQRAPNVISFLYALACHDALANILFHALCRAIDKGLYTCAEAEEVRALAVAAHSGVLRATIELVLAANERSGTI